MGRGRGLRADPPEPQGRGRLDLLLLGRVLIPGGPPPPGAASTLAELCQRCALCCDGSLFTVAPLEPGEVEGLRARSLPLAARADGAPGLGQPCGALAGTRCTIYADRPASCRRYRCLLYGSLAEGEVSLAEALEVVADARARLAARGDDDDLAALLDRRFRGRAPR